MKPILTSKVNIDLLAKPKNYKGWLAISAIQVLFPVLFLSSSGSLYGQQPVNNNTKAKAVSPKAPEKNLQPQNVIKPAINQQQAPTPATEPVNPPGGQVKQANPPGTIVLKWNSPLREKYTDDGPVMEFLNFSGALYDPKYHGLPLYAQRISLNPGMNHATVTIVKPEYEPVTSNEAELLGSGPAIGNDIIPTTFDGAIRGKHYTYLQIMPVRKKSGGAGYEKLVSFTLQIKQSRLPEQAKAMKRSRSAGFAANSVLATGKWYKIGVTADGVYKLDYNFFKRMGFNMNALVPANIRLFGNGGYMLPEANDSARADDLLENAIYVKGQNDISFGKNDYVLFYGQGPTQWTYNSAAKKYQHKVNLYSDTTFYFITVGPVAGKRITAEPLYAGIPADTVTTYDDYAYHELDATNLIQSGSAWVGEYFGATTSYNFTFSFPNLVTPSAASVTAAVASRYDNTSNYSVSAFSASANISVSSVPTGCYYCEYAQWGTGVCNFTATSPAITVTVTKLTAGAEGWLYYLELNVRRHLTMNGGELEYRDVNSTGAGKSALFTISSAEPQLTVWDVTNPQQVDSVPLTHNSGYFQYALQTNSLRQFISFTGNTAFDSAKYLGQVPNQDLHGMLQADLVIVSYPGFMTQAQQLASFHRSHDNLNVNVASTTQVYNEFSSGSQDPTAIRDFMRMFWTRAGGQYSQQPKYLVLLGGGSYDPKHRLSNNTNYVVCYEDIEYPSIPDPFDPTASFVSDDYFAVLDSNQGVLSNGYSLQLGVGRMPANTASEAQTLVNKVTGYETSSGAPANAGFSCCNQQAQYNLGNWRNTICFIACDGDGGLHEGYGSNLGADQLAQYVNANYKNINVNKIYLDAYQEIQTPGGPRYPEVNAAINQQMNDGCLIINYTGHGGPLGLAGERVLGFSDINSWTNISALSLFVTASCSFAPYDNPSQLSAGQLCVLLSTGGNIALMTTTRETYSGDNYVINSDFYQLLYSPNPDGSLPRIGDLFMNSKNLAGPSSQTMFTLLGDPAVRLAYPKERVYTTAVTTTASDTLKAFSKVTVTGYVGDTSGNPDNNFNGLLYPTTYDKPNHLVTDSNPNPTGNVHFHFDLQNSILNKGLISINKGKFSFSYVIPKDINYNYGFGKISYYAENGTTDATGNDQKIVVGGSKSNVFISNKGPQVRLYMNDSNFAYGGMTNQNPELYALVFDSNGINTTGNGIGHNITAVLDNNTQNTYDLTNSFQPALNSYQRGIIAFPFSSLSSGTHTVSLRVWNVFNASTQASTEFNVEQQSNLQLQHVLNYPNPFTTHTDFYFEINQVCDLLDVQIQIFTVAGKLVRNILTTIKTDSFRSPPIPWDGRDQFGDKIANGVYIYHVLVRTNEGKVADTYQKLVIL